MSLLSGRRQAREDRWRPTRIPRRDLRSLRGTGGGAVRATERSAGLLQLVLRQGPGRYVGVHARARLGVICAHETIDCTPEPQ